MDNQRNLRIKFWGVRGSIPTPTQENLGYGGNTTCLEVRCGEQVLIIDAGTGVRNLGASLLREVAGSPLNLSFLFTHFHWDHIQGLPFFGPLYIPSNKISFHAAGGGPARLQEILGGQMSAPYFPVSFEFLTARQHFEEAPKSGFRCGDCSVYPFPLNHPQGAHGYRIEVDGQVFVHASDFEPGDPVLDQVLREFARNADLLVIDSQYTPEEYVTKRGWGHGTWLESTSIARECNVGQLVLFHHDPSHDDRFLDQIVENARAHFENTTAAREGLEIEIPAKRVPAAPLSGGGAARPGKPTMTRGEFAGRIRGDRALRRRFVADPEAILSEFGVGGGLSDTNPDGVNDGTAMTGQLLCTTY